MTGGPVKEEMPPSMTASTPSSWHLEFPQTTWSFDKRPGEFTFVPWRLSHPHVWDTTCPAHPTGAYSFRLHVQMRWPEKIPSPFLTGNH